MKNKRVFIILAVIISILLTPLIAMQFTNEVQWSFFDFAIVGALLTFTGVTIEIALRKINKPNKKWAVIGTIAIICILIWVELAVGIFGSPFAGS